MQDVPLGIYKVAVDNSPDAIFILDKNLHVISTNNAAYHLTGEECVGKLIWNLNCLSQESKDIGRTNYESKMSGASIKPYMIEIFNKETKYVVINSDYLYYNGNMYTIIIATDVTEIVSIRKTHEELSNILQRSASEIVKTNEALEEFVHIVSHDLYEPLNKINTFAELAEKNYDVKYIQKIRSASKWMGRLIDDLLVYARVNTSDEIIKEIDINEIVKTVKDLLSLDSVIICSKLPSVRANKTQMIQLFQNLMANSIKFKKKDVPLQIVISSKLITKDKENYHRITLSDNGIGFDEKYSEHIFKIFKRLHGKKDYDGTGIGLAICSKIVQKHGGFIVAHGEDGVGASFEINLPA